MALEISREAAKSLQSEPGESKTKLRVLHEQYEQFKRYFSVVGENFNLEFKQFTKKLPSLKEAINKWSFTKSDEKKLYLATFSRTEWEKLSDNRKMEHLFANCKSCAVRYASVQALFPVKSAVLKAKAVKDPVFMASNVAHKAGKCSSISVLKQNQRDIKNTAKTIYEKVSPVFEKKYNVSLAEALAKVPGLGVQHKTINERRNGRRQLYRESKKNIERQMSETAFLR